MYDLPKSCKRKQAKLFSLHICILEEIYLIAGHKYNNIKVVISEGAGAFKQTFLNMRSKENL